MKTVALAGAPMLAAAGLLVALGLATPAAAQISAEQACSNDAYRLCERFIPDRVKVGACLRRNKRQLSTDCRVFFSPRKKLRRR